MVFSAGHEKDIICLSVEGCEHNYGYSVGYHIRTIYLLTKDSFVKFIFSHFFNYVCDRFTIFTPEHVHVHENLFIFPYLFHHIIFVESEISSSVLCKDEFEVQYLLSAALPKGNI